MYFLTTFLPLWKVPPSPCEDTPTPETRTFLQMLFCPSLCWEWQCLSIVTDLPSSRFRKVNVPDSSERFPPLTEGYLYLPAVHAGKCGYLCCLCIPHVRLGALNKPWFDLWPSLCSKPWISLNNMFCIPFLSTVSFHYVCGADTWMRLCCMIAEKTVKQSVVYFLRVFQEEANFRRVNAELRQTETCIN